MMCALLLAVCSEPFGLDIAPKVLKALEPLVTLADCTAALEAVKTSPRARQYRDQVLASGRTLLNVDKDVICELSQQELKALKQESDGLACMRVHGLIPE
jgi:hypothetical protein